MITYYTPLLWNYFLFPNWKFIFAEVEDTLWFTFYFVLIKSIHLQTKALKTFGLFRLIKADITIVSVIMTRHIYRFAKINYRVEVFPLKFVGRYSDGQSNDPEKCKCFYGKSKENQPFVEHFYIEYMMSYVVIYDGSCFSCIDKMMILNY